MTDEEYRQQVNQRWKETMALLGFDDPGPAPEGAPAPPKPPQTKTEAPREPEPLQQIEPRRVVAEFVQPVEEGIRSSSSVNDSSAGDAQTVVAQPVEAPSDIDGDDDRGGRRRRGRRGRRGKKSDGSAGGEGPATEQEALARPSEDKDEGPKRGRGRTRERPASVKSHHRADKEESALEETSYVGDIGDDEPTDLSDWDIPSWQELISSLYRPER